MIEILILFQNLCLEIGELHNWEWINWGLVQTAINQIWLGEKSGNMKVFTTNHQHQDCYKISSNCYKISSKVSPNIIKIVTNIIKIVTKYHQDCYQISSQSSSDVPLPSPPWSIRSFDGLLFPKRDTSLQIWSQNTPGQKTFCFENLKKILCHKM